MTASAWLGVFLIVGAGAMAWWAVSGIRMPTAAVKQNLTATTPTGTVDLRSLELSRSASDRVLRPATNRLAEWARRFTPQGWIDSVDKRVKLAGATDTWPPDRVLSTKMTLGIVGLVLGVFVFVSDPSLTSLLWVVLFTGVGFFLPDAMLSRQARKRQEEIERSLPDVLDQVCIAVEAGLGFEPALTRAAVVGHGPLAEELARTMSEIRAGVPRDVAFENLENRTEAPDLRHFVLATQQAHRHGIPIAKVLRVQAAEVRDKRRQRAEEAAQKVPVKVLFPLMLCIMPAMLIVVLGPAAIRIRSSF
jgi:tight adherence protein C